MPKLPVTVMINLSAYRAGMYRAHLSGWGVDDLGHYGSLWVRDVDLDVPSQGSSEEVLRGLAAALDKLLD